MKNNDIEQIINKIEDYINSCKFLPLSSINILVNKSEIETLFEELKTKAPDEIKKYQRMLENRDKILENARKRADNIIADAAKQVQILVNHHEIMQQAYIQRNDIIQQAKEQAQRIIDDAKEQAEAIMAGTVQYTNERLDAIENTVANSMENAATRYDGYMKSLQKTLETVMSDRKELNIPPEPVTPQQNIQPQAAAASEEEIYPEEDINEIS